MAPATPQPANLSYCHHLVLPLQIDPPPAEPYLLRICLHSQWIPLEDSVVHLVGDRAFVSHTSLHAPPLARVDYEPADLWQDHVERCGQGHLFESIRAQSEGSLYSRICRRLLSGPLVAALVAILAMLPAFITYRRPISTTTVNQTADLVIWQPVELVHRTYQQSLPALFAPVLFNESMPVPSLPHQMLGAFEEELDRVDSDVLLWEHMLGSWEGLPALNASLVERVNRTYEALVPMWKDYRKLSQYCHSPISCTSTAFLAWELDTADSTQEIIQIVRRFWEHSHEDNERLLSHLHTMKARPDTIGQNLVPILDEIESQISPVTKKYGWMHNLLDAADFIRKYYVGIITQVIPIAFGRAYRAVNAIDSAMLVHIEHWREMEAKGGITEQFECVQGNKTAWYSFGSPSCRLITTRHLMDR